MIKSEEGRNPNSCWNRALSSEPVFVLLARDAAAPFAIRNWIEERIRLGKNKPGDIQTMEAERLARAMEKWAIQSTLNK